MATTATGTYLTEQHRQAQLTLRAAFMQELTRLWPLINLEALDETAAEWISFVADLILMYRSQSVDRALAYYESFRRAETGQPLANRGNYRAAASMVEPAAITTSLLVTGPLGVKSRIKTGLPPKLAKAKAMVDVSGAASRHVLNGGRHTIESAAEMDELALGFMRVTDDDPCAFCAMLSSRGPAYTSRASAQFTTERSTKRGPGQKYHDHCGCTVEPLFTEDAEWPGRAREFEQLWQEHGKGPDALKSFRAAYNAQRKSKKA